MKTNIIHNKTCEKMTEIDDNSIRLIVTSPPYYNAKDYNHKDQIGINEKTYEKYIERMVPVWKECYRVLKPNGKMCINSPILPMDKKTMNTHHNRDYLNINNDIEFSILNNTKFYRYGLTIWDKGSTDQLMMGSYPYPPNFYGLNTIEFINTFVKEGQPEKIDKTIKEASKLSKKEWREYISTIWRITVETKRHHPAPFPLALPTRLIRLYSFVGDIVLDPFMGSGTTALACKENKRHYIGYELNEEYIKIADNRLGQMTLF